MAVDEERGAPEAGVEAKLEHEGSHHGHRSKGGRLPLFYLASAMLLRSAGGSALAWLLAKGEPYFTTCNILCTSNVLAAVTLWPIFRKDLTWAKIKALRPAEWLVIFMASIFRNVTGPYFEVTGLELTNVPTFAIIENLETVEFLLFALCILKHERRNRWIFANAGLIVIGVLIALFEPAMVEGSKALPQWKGVVFLAIGGLSYVLAELLSHLYLDRMPLGIYCIFRTLLGTLFFHLLAWSEGERSDEGTKALEDIYSWTLWRQMLWYGLIFITVEQYVWLQALKHCPAGTISIGTSTVFPLSLAFSAILLRVLPTRAQYIGSAFILASTVSGLVEAWKNRKEEEEKKGEKGAGEEDGDASVDSDGEVRVVASQEGGALGGPRV